jgi:hypothetical protein
MLLVEMAQDPAELWVFPEIAHGAVTAGDEDAGEGGELGVADGGEGARVADLLVEALDELFLAVEFVVVSCGAG